MGGWTMEGDPPVSTTRWAARTAPPPTKVPSTRTTSGRPPSRCSATWRASGSSKLAAVREHSPAGWSVTERVGGRARVLTADLAAPLDFAADQSADLVVASLVLHYLADWTAPLAEFHRVLAPDGAVVFSTHHPSMDWRLHSPDNYFAMLQVTETWEKSGQPFEVTFWRRPLTAMTAAISDAGFVIDRLVEPEPSPELRQRNPQADARIRTGPRFLFFRLVKRGAGSG
jgi:SAM-dependent methyltransferase